MEPVRISAKSLGELALPLFCPRCFWVKRHAARLPFQIFPGIFSSIDSYSKKITNTFYRRHRTLVQWFAGEGLEGEPVKVPHHSKFNILDAETQVLLTGVPDEILHLSDGTYAILDYKTARFTPHQDALMPMYEVQLNVYAYIGERLAFRPVSRLWLVYYEPLTDISDAEIDSLVDGDGFRMGFSANPLPVEKRLPEIPPLLEKVRELHDLPVPPEGRPGCADCAAMDDMTELWRSVP